MTKATAIAARPMPRPAPVPEPQLVPARTQVQTNPWPETGVAVAVLATGVLSLLWLKAAPAPELVAQPAAQAKTADPVLAPEEEMEARLRPDPARLQLRLEPRPHFSTSVNPKNENLRVWEKLLAYGVKKRNDLKRQLAPGQAVFLGTVVALASRPMLGFATGTDGRPRSWPGNDPANGPVNDPAHVPAHAPANVPGAVPGNHPDSNPGGDPSPAGQPAASSPAPVPSSATTESAAPAAAGAGSAGAANSNANGLAEQAAETAAKHPETHANPTPAPEVARAPACSLDAQHDPSDSRCFVDCADGLMLNPDKSQCLPILHCHGEGPATTDCSWDPLVFKLEGNSIRTGGKVDFDMIGDGTVQSVRDIGPGTGVLVFDSNGNGLAGESGRELFGNGADLVGSGAPNGFPNGFEALAALVLKGEREGVIAQGAWDNRHLDSDDLERLGKAYGLGMRVGSLLAKPVSLKDAGIKEIFLSRAPDSTTKNFDGSGTDEVWRQGAIFTRADGSKSIYTDLWLDYTDVKGGDVALKP